MSKYTTEVRYICEVNSNLKESVGLSSVNTIIESARTKIFNFDYPIFDVEYRKVLETKILKHFYTREIGLETVGLWKLKLETKLGEIMPFYNQLYNSTLLEFNPLYTSNVERKHDTKVEDTGKNIGNINTTGNGTDTTSNTGKTTDRMSETPQGSLTDLESNKYLTEATIIDSTIGGSVVSVNSSVMNKVEDNNNTTIEAYLESVKGFEGGSASKLLLEYRQTFLNIDMQVIEDLEELFFQLW